MSRLLQRALPVALTCTLLLNPVQPVLALSSFSTVAAATTPTSTQTQIEPQALTSATLSTSETTPTTVFRVPDRPSPYGPDFYKVVNAHLYHSWGTPNSVTASIDLGPAPSFLIQGNIYVKDMDSFYLRDTNGDRLVGKYTPPYQVLDLRSPSHMTAEEIDDYIRRTNPSSPLIGLGAAFLEAQNKYGVNAHYLAAHAILESNWGTSAIARDKHNLFGFKAYDDSPYDSAAYFPGFKECILYVAYYIRINYLETNGRYYTSSDLKGMNKFYATDPDWAEKIASRMERMRSYQAGEYDKISLLEITAPPPNPPAPDPASTTPPASDPATPPSRGTSPSSPIPGADLADSYPPATLGQVATDLLNFRVEPTTEAAKLTTLSRGTPLVLFGKNSEGWYKAQTGGKTGWVFGDYIDTDTVSSELPANMEVPKDKTWTVKFNLPLSGASQAALQGYVSVVSAEGFVPTPVVTGPSPDVLLVKPPVGGYLPGVEYYLYIYKGLKPQSGAALPGSVRMKFMVQ